MKTLFKSILLATVLMFSGPIVHMAQANHALVPASCAVAESQFFVSVKNLNAKMYVANDAARDAIISKINEARLAAQQWAFEADTFMVGVFQDKGRTLIGTVMFKDHCVVPGTVKVFEAEAFIAFLTELGLGINDFTLTAGV
jgi:hypothetical protein